MASVTNMSLQVPQLISIAVGAAPVAVIDYRIVIVGSVLVISGAACWLWRRRAAAPAQQVDVYQDAPGLAQ